MVVQLISYTFPLHPYPELPWELGIYYPLLILLKPSHFQANFRSLYTTQQPYLNISHLNIILIDKILS